MMYKLSSPSQIPQNFLPCESPLGNSQFHSSSSLKVAITFNQSLVPSTKPGFHHTFRSSLAAGDAKLPLLTDRTARMRTFTSTTVVEQPGPSNRRQPVRQTRNNPNRASTTATLTAGLPADAQDALNEPAPGLFPAITHFTDAITQLPKEMVRHYQMLKEVDAKTFGPEERLGQLLSAALKGPVPKPADSRPEIGIFDSATGFLPLLHVHLLILSL